MTAFLLILMFILALGPDSAAAQSATITGTEILKLTASGRHEEARTRAIARIATAKDDIDAYEIGRAHV